MSSPPALLSADERHAPRALVEHALTLIGRIHRGHPEAIQSVKQELLQWRQAAPANAAAAATAQRIWDLTDASDLRSQILMPDSAPAVRLRRRRVVGLLGVAAGLVALSSGGRWYWQQPIFLAALKTLPGRLLSRTLPDGSKLDLAAATRANVSIFRDRRTVWLEQGEIRCEVTHDEARPFTVTTPWGQVRVLGTLFTVAARDGRMRVEVARGRVAVWPASTGSGTDAPMVRPTAELRAGEGLEFDTAGTATRFTVNPEDVGDWTQGWLSFRNTRLADAVARWNDYVVPLMRIAAGQGLEDLRLTGSYPLRDPQAFYDSLPAMLKVRLARRTDGVTEIQPRH